MMKTFAVFVLVIVVIACAAAAVLFFRLGESYRAYDGTEQFVEIPQGAGSRTIGERLVAGGIVKDPLTFRLALWRSGKARQLKAGEYRFEHAMTARK